MHQLQSKDKLISFFFFIFFLVPLVASSICFITDTLYIKSITYQNGLFFHNHFLIVSLSFIRVKLVGVNWHKIVFFFLFSSNSIKSLNILFDYIIILSLLAILNSISYRSDINSLKSDYWSQILHHFQWKISFRQMQKIPYSSIS